MVGMVVGGRKSVDGGRGEERGWLADVVDDEGVGVGEVGRLGWWSSSRGGGRGGRVGSEDGVGVDGERGGLECDVGLGLVSTGVWVEEGSVVVESRCGGSGSSEMDRCVRSGLLCRLCIFPVLSIPVGAGVAVGGVWFVLGNELVLAEPAEVGVGFVGVVERLEGVDVERRFAPGGRRGRARARVSLAEEEVVGVRREWMRFVSRAVLLGWPMLVLLVLVQVSCVGRVDGRRSASRGGGGCERRSVSLDGHLGPGGMWEGVLEEDRIGVQLCV